MHGRRDRQYVARHTRAHRRSHRCRPRSTCRRRGLISMGVIGRVVAKFCHAFHAAIFDDDRPRRSSRWAPASGSECRRWIESVLHAGRFEAALNLRSGVPVKAQKRVRDILRVPQVTCQPSAARRAEGQPTQHLSVLANAGRVRPILITCCSNLGQVVVQSRPTRHVTVRSYVFPCVVRSLLFRPACPSSPSGSR